MANANPSCSAPDAAHASPLPLGTPVRTWDGATGIVTGFEPGWIHVLTDHDGMEWAYLPHQVQATEAA